ncbi:MAG: hypothetical protein CFH10_00840 [Alphaproteobacteria bacterium MarineAlpha4_Bin2]|nr:MAG: hypothetical protein CFH10_00840 [Alphaproteobacteria bacterium MarineAlpha4_Bin2]
MFEFIHIGAYVKVTAVDEQTGIEVSIVGDRARSEHYLKRIATQKLNRVMTKRMSETG